MRARIRIQTCKFLHIYNEYMKTIAYLTIHIHNNII